ncbi:arylamine N-acetyltransferase family protein [Solihabitans fulvus]|uniref:arylamine N-acetyltransferase family protein n=1 Tax=Solihabitans fulvus TaxID=1892852 RepID=UPI001661E961|nr:arylamine N-acetyltransferase [Solihabitans fulvus]
MDADAYLERIGASRRDTLAELQGAHLRTVPFENLGIHLGEPIVLDEAALLAKIVGRRRGGFCYELNGAFAALLRELGHEVTLLSARPFGRDGVPGPPFDHLALRVEAAEPLLVDVGFGRFSRHPLRLAERGEQRDPEGVFRLVDTPDGDIDVFLDGSPEYRLETRPRDLRDFVPTCWWQQTSPDSHFTRSLTCSLTTAEGRITLSGNRLIRTEDGVRTEDVLPDDAAILAAYRDHFGVVLDRVPVVSR